MVQSWIKYRRRAIELNMTRNIHLYEWKYLWIPVKLSPDLQTQCHQMMPHSGLIYRRLLLQPHLCLQNAGWRWACLLALAAIPPHAHTRIQKAIYCVLLTFMLPEYCVCNCLLSLYCSLVDLDKILSHNVLSTNDSQFTYYEYQFNILL